MKRAPPAHKQTDSQRRAALRAASIRRLQVLAHAHYQASAEATEKLLTAELSQELRDMSKIRTIMDDSQERELLGKRTQGPIRTNWYCQPYAIPAQPLKKPE